MFHNKYSGFIGLSKGAAVLVLLLLFSFKKLPTQPSAQYAAYIFLSENCPICQSETIELKNLNEQFAAKGVEFVGVFPNTSISTEASIKKFKQKFSIPFMLKIDAGQELTKQFSATITPQVFVVRKSDNKVLYSGKIDNSYERIGKRRTVVTEHYLQMALQSILKDETPNPSETKAIGCFIFQNSN